MDGYKTEGFITSDLARWAAGLTFDNLGTGCIEAVKRFWLDALACAIGGSETEDARILLEHHRAMSPAGDGPCSVFLTPWRTNPVDAAFLNSHMVRAMDFNDIYWQADPAHPSDLICGPLSLCEMLGRSGRDLIVATTIAYELQCRFAEIGRPGIREYGWHHATLSGFAAPVAAGRALGLSPRQIEHAIGISAARTGTLGAVTAGELTMMKNTVDPWASRVGVESAMLAQRGFTGPRHIIDGKEGLAHVFGHTSAGGKPCAFDLAALIGDLPATPGDAYRVERCGMKSVPVEALMHSPLSAIEELRRAKGFNVRDVQGIQVEVIARAADILGDPAKYRPTNRETADHSLPYAIAVLLVDGMLGPAQFNEQRVADTSLHRIMDMVRVVPSESFEQRFPACQPSRVTVELAGGSSVSAEVEYPRGDPRSPMTWGDLERKLRSLAEHRLGSIGCERLAEAVAGLDGATSVASLFPPVGGSTGAG